jgi:hypothetical protein
MRPWRRTVTGMAVFVAVAGGSTAAAAAEEPERATGEQVGQVAAAAAGPGVQDTYVPLPDLGLAPRRPDGGITLLRMPLSDLEGDFGVASRVRALPASTGYMYDRSKVVAGDFGDLTAGDDGTADHVIWHTGSDGGIRVYGVGGGRDTAPRLWRVLPHSGGWTWADSRPMAGDVNGDGWDDLVVVHRSRTGSIVWVMLSNGAKLGAPVRWGTIGGDFGSSRNYVADADGDAKEDLLTTSASASGFTTNVLLTKLDGTGSVGTSVSGAVFPTADGWSLSSTRQLAGDVDGDGLADLVTVDKTGSGGVRVSVSANCAAAEGDVCWGPPAGWQTLAGGWSWANSRQFLADTNGDSVDDLVSIHRSSTGGMLVWRHVSIRTTLDTPEQIANLTPGSGWLFSQSRESVANTWGVTTP